MKGRDKFKKVQIILILITGLMRLTPRFFKLLLWDCISRYSQIPFIGLRYCILKSMANSCGDNVRVGTSVRLLNIKKLSIGSNVSIHDFCYIDAAGGIEIGDNVSIAHNTSILSTNHDWSDKFIPIKYNPTIADKVLIKDDVWLGCAVRVLPGVTINSRSILAAGAVVNKNVDSNSIYGGVPAKKIKSI